MGTNKLDPELQRQVDEQWEDFIEMVMDEPLELVSFAPVKKQKRPKVPNSFRRTLRWSIEQEPYLGYRCEAWSRLHESSYRCVDYALVVTKWFEGIEDCWRWLRTGAADEVKTNAASQPIALTPMEELALDPETSEEDRNEILDMLLEEQYSYWRKQA